jgi:hypothetical protein
MSRPTIDELFNAARPAILDRWTDPKNVAKGAPPRNIRTLEDLLFDEVSELFFAPNEMKEWEAADVAVCALMLLAELARRKSTNDPVDE